MACTKPKCMLVAKGQKAMFAGDCFGEKPGSCHVINGIERKLVYVPCGRCIACRRDRRMDYTVLQCLEASLYDDNWFITLTYADDCVDWEVRSLLPKQLSDFNELMRKYCAYHGAKYRFFGCGEYGDLRRRPHYHLSVFGLPASLLGLEDADDIKVSRRNGLNTGVLRSCHNCQLDENGNPFWQSRVISDRWVFGSHKIYRANKDTFQYVAGYVTKKLFGESAKEQRLDGFANEYSCQSRPSIGFPWYQKYKSALSYVDGDRLVNDTISCFGLPDWRVPRVMRRWQERYEPEKYDALKYWQSLNFCEPPDVEDNSRKQRHDEYGALRAKYNNKHREVQ